MIIAPNVELPDEVLAQPISILGRTGSGKTYTAKGIVERLLAAKRRTCIVDPTGVWWGLRAGPDGRAGGFPVLIFGGGHADAPITEHAGAAVGRVVATSDIQCIVDLKDLLIGQQRRFMAEFFEAVYHHNRSPLHLVIDEADEFGPKNIPAGAADAAVMLGRFDRIARRGRTRGFRLLTITQRPAKLHNDILGMAATLICHQLTLPHDRRAVQEWIKGQADPERGKEVLDSLPRLKRGEGWVWCPDADVLARTRFPAIQTFDSSATPDDDAASRQAIQLAAVDLGAVKSELAAAIEEVKASDPKTLRARIAELEKQINRAGDADPEELAEARSESETLREQAEAIMAERDEARGRIEQQQAHAARLRLIIDRYRTALRSVQETAEEAVEADLCEGCRDTATTQDIEGVPLCQECATSLANADLAVVGLPQIPPIRGLAAMAPPSRAYATPTQPSANGVSDRPKTVSVRDGTARAPTPRAQGAGQSGPAPHAEGLEGPHRKVLGALYELGQAGIPRPSVELVGFASGYVAGGGSFKTYLSRLSSLGLVDRVGDGTVSLNKAGIAAAPRGGPLRLEDLHRRIEAVVEGPHWKILSALMQLSRPLGTRLVSVEAVAQASGYEPDGGSFKTYLSRLSTLGLVRRSKGTLQPSSVVYPEGLK